MTNFCRAIFGLFIDIRGNFLNQMSSNQNDIWNKIVLLIPMNEVTTPSASVADNAVVNPSQNRVYTLPSVDFSGHSTLNLPSMRRYPTSPFPAVPYLTLIGRGRKFRWIFSRIPMERICVLNPF